MFTAEEYRRYTEDDIEAVVAVLRRGSLSVVFGHQTRRFEQEFARHTGTAHAVATSSGTAALEIGLDLLDVGFGDEVVIPGYTFTSVVLAVLRNFAIPVFADIDPQTWNVSAATVAAALTERTRAVVVAHMFGAPADIGPIAELCRERGVALVEDCAQAAGAVAAGRRVGSFGDLGIFSFNEIKNLTTGEGGMITLDDPDLAERARLLRLLGVRNLIGDELGTKATMTEMEAALGCSQLARLDTENAARTAFGTRLAKLLADIPGLHVQHPPVDATHVYSRFVFCIDPAAAGATRDEVVSRVAPPGPAAAGSSLDEVVARVAQAGLALQPVYACPLYRQPVVARLAGGTASPGFARSYLRAYSAAGQDTPLRRWQTQTLPVAEQFCDTQLGFMVPPSATEKHADRIAADVLAALTPGTAS